MAMPAHVRPTNRLRWLLAGLLVLAWSAAPAAVSVTPNAASVPRYDVYELTLADATAYANPWEDVVITAVFTSPSARTYAVGGFHYDTGIWKLRFAPMEVGTWTWTLGFDNGSGVVSSNGTLTCTASNRRGFLRVDQLNPRRLVTEGDGRAFYVNGFNRATGGASPLPLMDSIDDAGQPIPLTDSLPIYVASGLNLIRENSQNINRVGQFNVSGSGKNTYLIQEGKVGDALAQALQRSGMKFMLAFLARPNQAPTLFAPNYDVSDPMVKRALESYHRYMIDRYGAYVDIWELGNEMTGTVSQAYLDTVTAVCQAHDPYRHPTTNSYQMSGGGPRPNEAALSVASDHFYTMQGNLAVDRDYQRQTGVMRSAYPGKPVFCGECGQHDPYGQYDPQRYRVATWSALTSGGGTVFWQQTVKFNFHDNGLANQYIGAEERLAAKIMANACADLDTQAAPLAVTLGSPAGRAYALGSGQGIAAYVVHTAAQDTPLSGATLTLAVPTAMQGQWIDPASGLTLQSFSVAAGSRTLAIPTFRCDIALRLRATVAGAALEFSTAAYTVREDQGAITIAVTRGLSGTGAVSVRYATGDGLALAGSDYTAASGTLTWADGDLSPKTFTIPITDDAVFESDKDIRLALSGPTGGAALGANATALVRIREDDVNAVLFSQQAYTVRKDAGSATITLIRRGNAAGTATVSYSTFAAAAAAAGNADFTAVTGTVTWAAGDLAPKSFTIPILDNPALTSIRYVNLQLSTVAASRTWARTGYERATLAILPNAAQPGVLVLSGHRLLTDMVGASGYIDRGHAVTRGAGSVAIPVSRLGGSTGAVGVSYSVLGGNAVAGADYTAVSGRLSWADGDSSDKLITVPIPARASASGNAVTWVAIGTPTGGAGLPFSGNVAIWNSVAVLITDPSLPPVITSQQEATGATGSAFAYAITATSGPTTFSASGLPAGLTLDSTTGVIAGTPAAGAAGTYDVRLGAANAGGTGAGQLVLTIGGTSAPR
jgi:hypothetical protein